MLWEDAESDRSVDQLNQGINEKDWKHEERVGGGEKRMEAD